jgi:hypothetical protein
MSKDGRDAPREYASSPCYQQEFEHHSAGMPLDEIGARLSERLEGERAGARGLIDMKSGSNDELESVLDDVAKDEARFCAMLHHHLLRLGHEPSPRTGVFYEKGAKRPTLKDKLVLLDRGQSAVVRMLDDLLPSIRDEALAKDLEAMRETHVRNIERCAAYLQD